MSSKPLKVVLAVLVLTLGVFAGAAVGGVFEKAYLCDGGNFEGATSLAVRGENIGEATAEAAVESFAVEVLKLPEVELSTGGVEINLIGDASGFGELTGQVGPDAVVIEKGGTVEAFFTVSQTASGRFFVDSEYYCVDENRAFIATDFDPNRSLNPRLYDGLPDDYRESDGE